MIEKQYTKYQCGTCGREYMTEQETLQCEGKHINHWKVGDRVAAYSTRLSYFGHDRYPSDEVVYIFGIIIEILGERCLIQSKDKECKWFHKDNLQTEESYYERKRAIEKSSRPTNNAENGKEETKDISFYTST